MYACLHVRNPAHAQALLPIARQFSPAVEETGPDTVVFSIGPLRKLIGSPHQIAAEICRLGYENKIEASLAIAGNVDTAILLAQHTIGVILVTPGEEQLKLAPIPLSSFLTNSAHAMDPSVLAELQRWGLRTCEDLAALPERGIAERLGNAGVYCRRLASGLIDRPLRVSKEETEYTARLDLDHAVVILEPLLFVFARLLKELCSRMEAQNRAARAMTATLQLPEKEFQCTLEFPVPLREQQSMLKLLQLHLERHAPDAPVTAVQLQLEVSAPKRSQTGLFLPLPPAPDKLQMTVARIANLVGTENIGIPSLPNTYRPDAFEMNDLRSNTLDPASSSPQLPSLQKSEILRLAMRLFRPALEARVLVEGMAPYYVRATGVRGSVLKAAGPWKTSGEWWATTAWVREEWDVALEDGALYRIYLQPQTESWYVAGVYD
jgi:protein ImuB